MGGRSSVQVEVDVGVGSRVQRSVESPNGNNDFRLSAFGFRLSLRLSVSDASTLFVRHRSTLTSYSPFYGVILSDTVSMPYSACDFDDFHRCVYVCIPG